MSWMQKLYETYERAQQMELSGEKVMPVVPSHTTQQAHIEVTIDADGNFLRASIVPKEDRDTLIPATESSSSRTSGGEPHPLCDKVQYVAGDYPEHGGEKISYFEDFKSGGKIKDGYYTLLSKWCKFSKEPKLHAVYKYISKRSVVKDLVEEKILRLDDKGRLLKTVPSGAETPAIFSALVKKKDGYDQGDVFIRWAVNIDGELENRVWKDKNLRNSWIAFDSESREKKGICLVSGEDVPLASLHPYKIRHSGDKAKIISSNDSSGYTFRGRFTDSDQACSIGYEVTQKAHSALRWLVARQAFRNDDQAIVAWEVSGKDLPKLMENTEDALFASWAEEEGVEYTSEPKTYDGDMGQTYALKVRSKIAGYRQELDDRDDIVIMGLDSATPGRMAITYYRELKGSEFLDRLEDWHLSYAWFQYYSKDYQFLGVPSPKDIAAAAYGRRIDAKLSKSTVSRILPCIADGADFPEDLEKSVFNRAKNRIALEPWEWEKVLGIVCGLFKGLHKEMNYKMALEPDRHSRDYLYGRLLAIAERTERVALNLTGEKRDTNAAKLMHRFAERPFSTWKQIEMNLVPYKTRLQSSRTAFLAKMANLTDEIHNMFESDDYIKDTPLSGEFLLGYHCQRYELKTKAAKGETVPEDEIKENLTDMEDE